MSVQRRLILAFCTVLAAAWNAPAFALDDDPAKAPLARNEPRHHLLMQNKFVRIMRVVIPAGQATLWHEHNFDFFVVFVDGSKLHGDLTDKPAGVDVNAVSKSFGFVNYAGKHFVHRMHDVDSVVNHQLAFELVAARPYGFTVGDRSAAPQYKMELDNDRVRVWRLKLAPGEIADTITQKAPGVRFVLAGERLTETRPDGRVDEKNVRSGDYAWMPDAAVRSLANVGTSPLELLEIEIK